MGAFATITLPLAGRLAVPIVEEIVGTFPGTRSVAVSAAADSVTFELHFPGNLSALVARLAASDIIAGPHGTISVPAEVLAPERTEDASDTAETLNHGPHVWDPEFTRGEYVSEARLIDGKVEATIVVSTDAVHQVYDSMLRRGLTARGATPAGVA